MWCSRTGSKAMGCGNADRRRDNQKLSEIDGTLNRLQQHCLKGKTNLDERVNGWGSGRLEVFFGIEAEFEAAYTEFLPLDELAATSIGVCH